MSKKNIFLPLLWGIAIIVLLYNMFYLENGFFANGTIIIGWILFVYQYTINHSEKLYMLTHRAKSFLINNSNQWDFQFEFVSNDFELCNIDKVVNESSKIKKNINFNLSRKQITTENGLIIEISKDNSTNKVVFSINDLIVPYRESQKILDNHISPIIETILHDYTIKDVKFSLSINLKKKNPYYGFFLKNIDETSNLIYFQVQLKMGLGRIDILHDRVIISSNKFIEIARTAKDILAFRATS
ncbi:hypothetical protein MHH70_01700 [Metasolibacillus sp. FSL H7-0170]|uniref:hypothetical protein n=1 Tax=Metasolibacillus sp. FSL H7-0170 TaxID=2921431 RepID=UPI0031596E44